MTVTEAIENRRSIRKFLQKPVSENDIIKIINAGRLAAFGGNLQPLKFAIMKNYQEVYPLTKWAGYLSDWSPAEDERPMCYIAILGDTKIKKSFEVEAGSAIANMMLQAVELGLSTCWLGALDRNGIKAILNTDYDVVYLLAIGYAAQDSRVIDIENNDVKYFEDKNGVINVPKRTINEVLI